MKKILIRTGYLGLGAIEQLTFDIVVGLKDKFKIVLAIENHFNNSLVEKLPKEIEYFYLKTEEFENLIKKTRDKKSNILYKIKYNYLLKKEKQICCDSINNYIKENGKFDLFVDYDGMAYKYAEKINIDKKIIWQHTSMSSEKNIKRTEERLKKYDKVVLLCDDMKNDFIRLFPKLKEKFVRIYNFLDLDRIKTMSDKINDLTIEEKEMIKENYVVKVARLDYPKDFDTLISAFEILKSKGIKEKLYIIGDGEQKEDLENKIKNKKLEDIIFLLGRKTNPYVWVKNADIFVHSSKREGFGVVLIEAMVCNKMVISSDCVTGPKEILEKGRNGELYDVGDYETLAQLLKKYIENPELKNKFIENSKIRILNFERNKILLEIEDFFKKEIKN